MKSDSYCRSRSNHRRPNDSHYNRSRSYSLTCSKSERGQNGHRYERESRDRRKGYDNHRRRNERRNEYAYCSSTNNRSLSSVKDRSDRSSSKRSSVAVDKEGYLVMKQDQMLHRRYKIVKLLGEGTFGRVAQCKDNQNSSRDVAIKVIKAVKKYREAAMLEIKVLDTIKKHDPRCQNLCIFAHDWFDYHGHICIAFPLLGPSVFDFLKLNDYVGYPLRQVRYMAKQMVMALSFLHSLKLTHTDLKPENILFENGAFDMEWDERKERHVRVVRDATIRIIDFGSATFDHEHHTTVVATRHYRPLEVILELGWSQPVDVWSVGCILFELHTGSTLFMTHDNLEHLAMMERVLGARFPARMTRRSRRRQKYFDECGRLRWDPESKEGRQLRAEVRPLRRHVVRQDDIRELDLFDLVEEMLEYNPRKRISMHEASRHPFVCGERRAVSGGRRSASANGDSSPD